MAWMIGIDEAGYGPNLGPLVMTCVAFRMPAALLKADLWSVLAEATERHPSSGDGRLVVDDSKRLYSTARGLTDLETSVLAALGQYPRTCSKVVEHLCRGVSGAPPANARSSAEPLLAPRAHDLAAERWYDGTRPVPIQANGDLCRSLAERFSAACAKKNVEPVYVSSQVINARQFNELTVSADSKGAVLAHGLMKHVAAVSNACQDEELCFFVDKHGGRNRYAAMLQDALPEGMVTVKHESMNRSTYQVLGGRREVRFRFQPRADSEHFCVALASMVSKYLRELLMLDFNEFWTKHVPGIEPTAGYPGDSGRFYAEIQPALERLGIAEEEVWRCR